MSDVLAQLTLSLGHAVVDLIGLLGHEANASFVAGALVLAGCAAVAMLLVRSNGRVKQIKQGVAAVEMSLDAADFARHFDAISARIESSDVLRPAWSRFKLSLFVAQHPGATEASIQSTAAPLDYFSPSVVRDGWRDYRALPGLVLSLALVLMLAGVAGSMMRAVRAVDGGRPAITVDGAAPARPGIGQPPIVDRMQLALNRLLESGGASFSVAIAGVMVSLLLTLTLRIGSSRLRHALRAFAMALQRRIQLVSFEAIVLERLAAAPAVAAGAGAAEGDVKAAIEHAVPLHINAAMLKLQAALERNVDEKADASNATMRELVAKFEKLLDDRVADPVRGMTEQMQEQMLSVRGHLIGLVNVVTDGRPVSPLPLSGGARSSVTIEAATAVAASPAQLEALLSTFLRAMEQGQEKLAASSLTAVRVLADELTARIESKVADPFYDVAASVADLRDSIASMQSALSTHQFAPAAAAGVMAVTALPQAELAREMQRLLASLERSNAQIASTNKTETLQLVGDAVEQIKAALATPIQNVSVAMGQVQSKLATLAESQPDLATELPKLLAALEHSNAKIAVANRAANQRLAGEVVEQIRAEVALPIEGVAAAMADVRANLIAVAERAAQARLLEVSAQAQAPHDQEQAAALSRDVESLRQAVEAGHERIANDNRAAIGELLQALEQRQLDIGQADDGMIDAVTEIRASLGRLDAALAISSRSAVLPPTEADVAAQLQKLVLTVMTAISKGTDKVVTLNLQAINSLSDELTRRLETHVAAPMQGLVTSLGALHHTIADARTEAAQSGVNMEAGVSELVQHVRSAADEMRGAIITMMTQAQEECELARHELIEQITTSAAILGGATREFEQTGADITSRLKQVLEEAPVGLAREAEAAARTVQVASENARLRLDEALSAVSGSAATDTVQTTAALTAISEQLVRQATHTRDLLNTQLTATLDGIERASNNIDKAITSLNASLAQGTQTATADVLAQLTNASTELGAVTQRSNEVTVQSVAGIWQAAKEARTMIAADLAVIREQVQHQTELVNAEAAGKLRETADQVAIMMANYGGDLSSTATTLVQTLEALSAEMRRLETSIVDRDDADLEQVTGNEGPMAPRRRIGGSPNGDSGARQGTAAIESTDVALDRFIASRRSFMKVAAR